MGELAKLAAAIRATGESLDALIQSLVVFQEALSNGDSDNE